MLYNATNIKTIFDKKKTLEGLLIKKTKIIVSNYRAVLERDFCTLGTGNIPFPFIKTSLVDGIEFLLKELLKFSVHLGYSVLIVISAFKFSVFILKIYTK